MYWRKQEKKNTDVWYCIQILKVILSISPTHTIYLFPVHRENETSAIDFEAVKIYIIKTSTILALLKIVFTVSEDSIHKKGVKNSHSNTMFTLPKKRSKNIKAFTTNQSHTFYSITSTYVLHLVCVIPFWTFNARERKLSLLKITLALLFQTIYSELCQELLCTVSKMEEE